jgi:hypothetical protein
MSEPPFDSRRREVLRLAGLTALASAVPARAMAAAAKHKPAPPAPKPAAPGAPADAEKPLSDDARSLLEIIKRRHGTHLDAVQLDGIGHELDDRLESGRALRDAKLANGDEPDSTFHA